MADYKVVDAEKLDADLTGMADEVRTLADTDSKMSIETMTDNIADANEKVDSQTEIIAQIKTALQGKAGSGGGLPDWDEDSPIIASNTGINDGQKWELTEKGTLRWKIVKDYAGNIAGVNSDSLNAILMFCDGVYAKGLIKVRQVYVEDGFEDIYILYMPNCERIRLPETYNHVLFNMGKFKEIDFSGATKLNSRQAQNVVSLEKVILNPFWTTMPRYAFYNCASLREINLENITVFSQSCFYQTPSLEEINFSPNLVSIEANAFAYSGIRKVVFSPPTGELPTITSNSFINSPLLKDVYCSWAEGEVVNAPWGATNATIHYNTQFDENGNPITT